MTAPRDDERGKLVCGHGWKDERSRVELSLVRSE